MDTVLLLWEFGFLLFHFIIWQWLYMTYIWLMVYYMTVVRTSNVMLNKNESELKVFIIDQCWIFSQFFLHLFIMIIWFLFFSLLMCCITLIGMWKLSQPWTSLVAQMINKMPAMQETWIWYLGWEDTLKKGMAIHFSVLAWKIPWTRSLVGHGPWIHRVGHNWASSTLHPWDKHYLFIVFSPFSVLLNLASNNLFRIFASMPISDFGLELSLLCVYSIFVFGISMMLAL